MDNDVGIDADLHDVLTRFSPIEMIWRGAQGGLAYQRFSADMHSALDTRVSARLIQAH
jgi:hypothetical protein